MDNDKVIAKVKDRHTCLADLAKRSGVSIRTLMHIRHSDANPTMKTMARIAKGVQSMK